MWVYWIGGAIDFLFIVVGKTKGILFIELKLEFPIKTRSNSFPGVWGVFINKSIAKLRFRIT